MRSEKTKYFHLKILLPKKNLFFGWPPFFNFHLFVFGGLYLVGLFFGTSQKIWEFRDFSFAGTMGKPG